MRRYAVVSRRVWRDAWFRALPPDSRMLWLYLLTNPYAGPITGLVTAYPAMVAHDLRWPIERVAPELEALEDRCCYDLEAGLIWLPKAIRHDPPTSPNHVKALAKGWGDLPDSYLIPRALHGIAQELDALNVGWSVVFSQALPDPFVKLLAEPLPIQTPTQTPTPTQTQGGPGEPNPKDPWNLAPKGQDPDADFGPQERPTVPGARKRATRKKPTKVKQPFPSDWNELVAYGISKLLPEFVVREELEAAKNWYEGNTHKWKDPKRFAQNWLLRKAKDYRGQLPAESPSPQRDRHQQRRKAAEGSGESKTARVVDLGDLLKGGDK